MLVVFRTSALLGVTLELTVEWICAISVPQLNNWWFGERKSPSFPPLTIPLALHSWLDLKRTLLGHRTVEGNADGKSGFWGFKSTFCLLIPSTYLWSEDSHVLMCPVVWDTHFLPLTDPFTPRFICWGQSEVLLSHTAPPPPHPTLLLLLPLPLPLYYWIRGDQVTGTKSVISFRGQATGSGLL